MHLSKIKKKLTSGFSWKKMKIINFIVKISSYSKIDPNIKRDNLSPKKCRFYNFVDFSYFLQFSDLFDKPCRHSSQTDKDHYIVNTYWFFKNPIP